MGVLGCGKFEDIITSDKISFIDPQACTYKGTTLWGFPCGNGSLIYKDETTYNGIVYWYCLYGDGHFTHKDGRDYTCQIHIVREGQGTYIWADGARYDGNWHNGLRDGYGTMYYPDGTVVQGDWKEDVYVGGMPVGINDNKYKVPPNLGYNSITNVKGSIIDNYALPE